MSRINFPMMYVPDPVKGRPVGNGKIFVGIPDLDPEVIANQKQLRVVQEDGTKVDVLQPFILSFGGVPVYNGSTVRLDVDGNYSFKVLSKQGAQVYYIENVFEGQPITELDLINDLSQAYEFDTYQLMKDSPIDFLDGKVLKTKIHNTTSNTGGASYVKITGATSDPIGSPALTGGGYAELTSESNSLLLEQFGAQDISDNSHLILEAFLTRCNKDNLTGRSANKTYTFDFTGQTPAATTVSRWIGDDTTVIIKSIDETNFLVGEGFLLDGLTIQSPDTANTKTLFFKSGFIDNFNIGKLNLEYTGATQDGSFRLRGWFRVHAKNVNVEQLTMSGMNIGLLCESNNTGKCESFVANVINVSNYQTGAYLQGYQAYPAINPEFWFENISVGTLKGFNTEAQQGNFATAPGADILLVEGYKNVHLDHIDSERAIERAVYLSGGNGPVNVGGYKLTHSSGIKCVGLVDDPNVIEEYVSNVVIGKGTTKGGTTNDSFGRAVTLYDAEHVVVDVVSMEGVEGATQPYMETAVLLERHLKDVLVIGVTGEKIRNAAVVINQQVFNAGTFPFRNSSMEDITIQGLDVQNPCISANRDLIEYQRDPLLTGFTIKDLKLYDNYGKSTTEFGIDFNDFDTSGYRAISRLKGLITIDFCNGLYTRGNRIDGYSGDTSGWINLGGNNNRIQIQETMQVPNLAYMLDNNNIFRLSTGSEINFIFPDSSKEGVTNTRMINSTGQPDTIQRANLDSLLENRVTVNFDAGEEVEFPFNTGAKCACTGTIMDGNTSEYMDFIFDGTTVTSKVKSAAFSPTNINLFHCLYPSANGFTLRNRTGASARYILEFDVVRATV